MNYKRKKQNFLEEIFAYILRVFNYIQEYQLKNLVRVQLGGHLQGKYTEISDFILSIVGNRFRF